MSSRSILMVCIGSRDKVDVHVWKNEKCVSESYLMLKKRDFGRVSVLCLTPNELEAQKTGWQANLEKQYHIQTDEGPERYFRFQTLNGQYRKEKRLEDGTVIGTEGWVDPLGYLRIKDYIADAKGFRILKSKTIFMGKERTIHDAVVEVPRKVTNRPSRPIKLYRTPELRDLTSNSIEGSSSVAYVSSTLPPPSSPVRYGPIAITTLKPRPFTLPSRRSNELTSSSQIFAKKSYPLKPSPLVEAPPLPSLQVEHDDQNHVASSHDPATVRTLAPSRTFR
ncbi:hypothetical protein QAD02_001159 [Eretmocerus hayati]|uniref:Uncharacterized protein n=1 Tax=Eretmocerus hayati TaxID=131215 RepID=A0ACC2NK05_9HYME|nr:hypothetical protein QAD02_001159 [Eretmocerus hayati]